MEQGVNGHPPRGPRRREKARVAPTRDQVHAVGEVTEYHDAEDFVEVGAVLMGREAPDLTEVHHWLLGVGCF